MGPSVC
ncbi:hypothetical protein CKAN_01144500 [Cinnamomum micranthum f. kanehirae]|nr:hypothetical protein CKAN_01144500 [Cinnamomum micranthum f. kanehirae]